MLVGVSGRMFGKGPFQRGIKTGSYYLVGTYMKTYFNK